MFKGNMWGSGAAPASKEFNSSADNVVFRADSGYSSTFFDASGKQVNSNSLSPSDTRVTLSNLGSITGQVFTSGISWAGLTYSLNIANAFDRRIETLSRPTLMTFLKKEARFFSGTELVNVASGSYGSNLNRYPFGILLAILPVSIEDDRVTLDIGIESSNGQSPNPNLLTTGDIDKTKVETTARIRLGETIMLGGLYQRIDLQTKEGFPGLRDITFAQYFFSNEVTSSGVSSIVIMLTPRSPDVVKSAVNRAMTRESVQPHYSELVARNPDWFNPEANAVNIFGLINLDPALYYEFRTGDILPPNWSYEPVFQDRLAELASFLYY